VVLFSILFTNWYMDRTGRGAKTTENIPSAEQSTSTTETAPSENAEPQKSTSTNTGKGTEAAKTIQPTPAPVVTAPQTTPPTTIQKPTATTPVKSSSKISTTPEEKPTTDTRDVEGLSSSEISQILALHNTERATLGLSPLVWSSTLVASSLQWAQVLQSEGCAMYHSSNEYGENLYYALPTGTNPPVITPKRVVGAWIQEKEYYDYKTNRCDSGKMCGHYTQIVWADTTHVGCVRVTCPDPRGVEEIWVCEYNPPGNYTGERPY
jgi:pathogenesis-related protein 1